MRKLQGWTGLRATVIALGLAAWTTASVEASVLKYTTATTIDTANIAGPNAISFIPVDTGTVDLSQGMANASLGRFKVSPLPAGQSATYNNSKFSITFLPQKWDSANANGGTPLVFTGRLSGKVIGDSISTVNATFDKAPTSMTSVGNSTLSFAFPNSSLALVSDSVGGVTTAQTQILASGGSEAPVPEPSAVALFVTTLGGLGLRRYALRRRK